MAPKATLPGELPFTFFVHVNTIIYHAKHFFLPSSGHRARSVRDNPPRQNVSKTAKSTFSTHLPNSIILKTIKEDAKRNSS